MNNLGDEFPETHMNRDIDKAIIGNLNISRDNAIYIINKMFDQLDYMAKMETRINSLTAMLREIEYAGDAGTCPDCGFHTHSVACRLNKLLTNK